MYEHGNEFGRGVAFEDEARDAPFEVAQAAVVALVAAGFGEDVQPGVAVGGVGGGGWVGVGAVGGIGHREGFEGVRVGEEGDGLGDGGLVEAALGGVPEAVGWQDLA